MINFLMNIIFRLLKNDCECYSYEKEYRIVALEGRVILVFLLKLRTFCDRGYTPSLFLSEKKELLTAKELRLPLTGSVLLRVIFINLIFNLILKVLGFTKSLDIINLKNSFTGFPKPVERKALTL